MSQVQEAGFTKRPFSQAAASEGPRRYPLGYVEGLSDARTTLEALLNSLLRRSHNVG
jgi:hypothetical protein